MYRKDNGTILLVWALHQILLWEGLTDYGFEKRAEMVYGWFWLISKNAVEYNGTMPEKFDLKLATKVFY
jgi:alpha,alpha-trehalase